MNQPGQHKAKQLKLFVNVLTLICCGLCSLMMANAQKSGSVFVSGSAKNNSKPAAKPTTATPVSKPKPKPAPATPKLTAKPNITPKSVAVKPVPRRSPEPKTSAEGPVNENPNRGTISIPQTTPEIRALMNDAYGLAQQQKLDTCQEAAVKYKQASTLFYNISNKKGQADAANNAGAAFFCAGEYDSAAEWLLKASQLYHTLESAKNEAEALESLAKVYNSKDDAAQSAAYYGEAATLYQTLKSLQPAADAWFTAASLFANLKNYTRAREEFQKAAEIYHLLVDGKNELRAWRGIANSYENEKGFAAAIVSYSLALEIARAASPSDVPFLLNSLGNCQRQTGDFEKAILAHQEALSLFQAEAKPSLMNATQSYLQQATLELEKAKALPTASPQATPLPISSTIPPAEVAPTAKPAASPTPTPTPTPTPPAKSVTFANTAGALEPLNL